MPTDVRKTFVPHVHPRNNVGRPNPSNKLIRENRDEGMKDRYGTTSEDNIINIKKQNDSGRAMMVDKHKGIRWRISEAIRQKKTVEFVEPGPRACLRP